MIFSLHFCPKFSLAFGGALHNLTIQSHGDSQFYNPMTDH